MPRPISASYLERKARAVLGLAGSNPFPDLDAIRAFVELEVDRPEWRFPADDFLAGGLGSQAAGGAGTTSQIALINPENSGRIIVVTLARASVSYNLRLFSSTVDVAAFGAPSITEERGFRDTRLHTAAGGLQQPVADIGGLSSAAIVGFTFQNIAVAGELFFPRTPADCVAVLKPRSGLNVAANVQNTAIEANFVWYERPIEGSTEIK